jgi:hypothetical protein
MRRLVRFAPEPATTEHIAQIVSLILACAYGVDYLIEPPRASLYTVEELIGPLPPWGAMFLVFGIMGLIGELWMEVGRKQPPVPQIPYVCTAKNRWWPSFTAHVVLCAMYAGLAAGSVVEMIVNGHFYGARVVTLMIILTTWHAFFAQRRRNAP